MLPKDSRMLKENEYHPLQLKVFFIMITLYTFYFTCNNNLGVATDEIQKSFDLNNAQFGVLFTIFTLGFGAGQFFSGYLGDRYSQYGSILYMLGRKCTLTCHGMVSGMQHTIQVDT